MDALLAVLVVLALAVAAAPLIRLFARQDRRIFRPAPALDRTPATVGIGHGELRLTSGDDDGVTGWWIAGAPQAPVVVYFHGSAGSLTHELPVVQFLHRLGVSALLPEYVGYGGNGRAPSEAGCYRTAELALEHVRAALAVPDERVILFGHSLGAAVAARAAGDRRVAGLVLHSGFTSVPDLAASAYPYLPVRPFVRTRMDVLEAVPRCRCPVLVVHSRDDEHIPYDHGVRLFEAARTPKKLVTLEGSHFGHAWSRSPEVAEAWRQLLAGDLGTWTEAPARS